MEKLEVLDLEGNKVDDLGALVYLGWCPQLAVLTLADNPVAQEATYSAQVLMHLHIASHAWWLSSMLCVSDNHAVYIYIYNNEVHPRSLLLTESCKHSM